MPEFSLRIEPHALDENRDLVSVIIPAYNAATYIQETLRSVLKQSYTNLEVLVVDDGSTDSTPEVVKDFCRQDARVRLLSQRNQGVAAARNLAITHARGAFIAPIDADDIWYPGKIEQQVAVLSVAPHNVGLVYSWSTAISKAGRLLRACANWNLEGDVYLPLLYKNFIGNASVPLIRRECFVRIGGYDCNLRKQNGQGCEDWDLTLRIAEHFHFRVVPEFHVGYRQIRDSMSANVPVMGKSFRLILEDIRQRHPEIPDYVYNWSQSHFYLYLMGKAYATKDVRGGLAWLASALRSDHALLLAPFLYRFYLGSLLRLATGPRARPIWDMRDNWRDFWNAIVRGDGEVKTLEEMTRRARRPQWLWKPYDRVTNRRFLALINKAHNLAHSNAAL